MRMVGNGVVSGGTWVLSEKESKSISAGAASEINVWEGRVMSERNVSLFKNGSCCNVRASPRVVPESSMLKNPHVETGGECERR